MRVGESVLYSPVGGAQHFGLELAAIVTFIHKNGTLNLAIFDPYGNLIQNPPTNIDASRVVTNDSMDMPIANLSSLQQPASGAGITAPMPELPPGAKLVEQRPATDAEIANAEKGTNYKKAVKKPSRPRKIK